MILQSLFLSSALIVNADFIQYYKRPASEMNEAAMKAFVDRIAESGKVTHLFMNPVAQRANFKSEHWEPIWEGLGEPDSKGCVSNVWAVNSKLCHDRGLDLYAIWIARCREKGISPWISMRMNDVHNIHVKDYFCSSRFWREHPELRRCPSVDPVKNGWDWINVAFDYGKEGTRRHFLGAFRDLVDRYDADGFELDWMRFWAHLAPGRERLDAHCLTDFIRACRAYVDEKAKTRGHAIRISVRVQYGCKPAAELGLDPVTWAKEGLVDLVVPGNFWTSVDFGADLVEWKRAIAAANPKVKVIPSAADNVAGAPLYRGGQPVTCDAAILRGWSDLMNCQGADGLYFFNVDPETNGRQGAFGLDMAATIFGGGMCTAESACGPRRYVAPFHDCVLDWASDACQLPKPTDAAGKIVLNVGTAKADESVAVILGFDADGAAFRDLPVTLNGARALGAGVSDAKPARFGKAKGAVRYEFPKTAVRAGANEVAFAAAGKAAKVVWCEIALDFEKATELTLENKLVTVKIGSKGEFASIREKATGRELLRAVQPGAVARPNPKVGWTPIRFEHRGGDRYAWVFGEGHGEAVMRIVPFDGGWTFDCEKIVSDDIREFEFFRLLPTCNRYDGLLSNTLSDDESFVMVRPYDVKLSAGRLWVTDKGIHGLGRWCAGLAAGRREDCRPAWKAMTLVSGAPYTEAGGAWSADSPLATSSYLFVFGPIDTAKAEDYMELARRGGTKTLHFNWPTFTEGPDGCQRIVDLWHANGFYTSMHTFTGAIGPGDAYITPSCTDDLFINCSYTLARPFNAGDTVLYVNERPADDHACDWGYCKGNALKIGHELLQYTGVVREKPYCFTNVTHGAFQTTKVASYPTGTRVDYPQTRYMHFYPNPDRPIADVIAERVARPIRETGIDQVFLDASEGPMNEYAADVMRRKVIERIALGKRPTVVEASDYTPHSGWFHSRVGTEDPPLGDRLNYVDGHVRRSIGAARISNFMALQMGWWCLAPHLEKRPFQPMYESEYFICKCAANDAPMSIEGMSLPDPRPMDLEVVRQLTVFGWWERARVAKAFAPGVQEMMKKPGEHWQLRQDAKGVWNVTRVDTNGVALAASVPAFGPLTDAMRRELAYEAMWPSAYRPSVGETALPDMTMRPGEKATLAVEILALAPMDKVTLTVGNTFFDDRIALPVGLAKGDRFICRDGRTWKKVDAAHKVLATGALEKPFGTYSDSHRLTLTCADPQTADARVDLVKIYR